MDSPDRLNLPISTDLLNVNDIIHIISDLYDSLSKAELPVDPVITLVQDHPIGNGSINGGTLPAGDAKIGHKKSSSWSWRFVNSKIRTKKKKDGNSSISAGEKKAGSSSTGENGEAVNGQPRDNSVNNIGNHSRSQSENQAVSNESVNGGVTDLVTSQSLPIINFQSTMSNPFEKLCSDLHYMKSTFHKLKDFEHELGSQTRILGRNLKIIMDNIKQDPASYQYKHVQSKLREISKIVFNLKCQIPLPHKLASTRSDPSRQHLNFNMMNIFGKVNLKFPNLHLNDEFHDSIVFKEIKNIFENLEINVRLCLLCFAVFPDNAKIKKRLLMYWWIGERFINVVPGDDKTVEEIVKGILMDFTVKGLVVPVNKKRSPDPSTFMMRPIVRSAVISLANEYGFFEFDGDGIPIIKTSSAKKACLGESKEEASRQEPANVEKLQTLFNVSERFPDFTFKWFLKMKDLRVLYLGRWESTADRHIEVESTEYLKDLKNMKHLRFLSFQGISRIEELNDSICKLSNLTILDLRACYNLESLPDRIDLLKNLTHLDISECYLLDHMPKKISSLTKLQVLKGFVVSDVKKGSTCSLDELSLALENLRKLSINVNSEVFSFEQLINSIQNMKKLQSLKVAWGGGFITSKPDNKISHRINSEVKPKATKQDKQISKDKSQDDKSKSTNANSDKTTHSKEEGTRIKNQDKSMENKRVVGNPVDTTTEENREKEHKSSSMNSKSNEQTNSGENKKVESDIKSSTNLKGDNEIEEIEPVFRNHENKATENAAKSEPKKVDKEESGAAQANVATQPDKKNKKKVEFLEEPGKNMSQDKGGAGDNKNSGSAARQPARSLSKRFSLSFRQLKGGAPSIPLLPANLEKLDLQCFPDQEPPIWLRPENLSHLKKLCIRGGNLSKLGEFPKGKNENCAVEVLRLKYLSGLKMNWMELQAMFPNLVYLEKFRCPKITFCPCDGLGVWVKKTE